MWEECQLVFESNEFDENFENFALQVVEISE